MKDKKSIFLLVLAVFLFGIFVLNNLVKDYGGKVTTDIKCLNFHSEVRVLLKDERTTLDKNENIIISNWNIGIAPFVAIVFLLIVLGTMFKESLLNEFFLLALIILIIIFFLIQSYIDNNKLTQLQTQNKIKKEIALKTEKCYYENYKIGWIDDKKYFSLLNSNNKKELGADDYFFLSNVYKKSNIVFKDINKSKNYLDKAMKMNSTDAKKAFAENKKVLAEKLYEEGNYKDLKTLVVDKGFGFKCKYTELLYKNKLVNKADDFAKKYDCKDVWARFH